MLGLRTAETPKFNKFFEMVQNEARNKDSVFFMDCGQGRTFENETIECEDLCGWLIPKELEKTFEPLFVRRQSEQNNFDDFYVFVDFFVDEKGNISIEIDDTPNDLIIDEFNLIKDNVIIAN